jgi:protein phosphatase
VRTLIEQKRANLAEAAAVLVDAANQNGGRDNISVVLVRVPAGYLPAPGWAQRWLAKKRAS